MSYNISSFKLKKLENLVIPVKEFYPEDNRKWHPRKPEVIDIDTNTVEIEGLGEGSVKGILEKGMLHVTEICISGEGSGWFMKEIMKPVFKASKGKLEATLVWEGGDSITKIKVLDGKFEAKNADI